MATTNPRSSSPGDPDDASVALRRVRWFAAVFSVVQFLLYAPPEGMAVPFPRLATGLTVAAAVVAVNVASMTVGRRVGRPHGVGVVELAFDTVIVLTIVGLFSFDSSSALWALLVIPVLEGAFRAGLVGAAGTWAGVSACYVVIQMWASSRFAGVDLLLDSYSYRLSIVGVVALGAGSLASRLHDNVGAHHAARAVAERRASLLRAVAGSSRRMATLDSREILAEVERAARELGFVAAVVSVFRDDGPRGMRLHDFLVARGESVVVSETGSWDEVGGPDGVAPGLEGTRSFAVCPVRVGGEVVGALVVSGRPAAVITPEEIECLELLAAQAGAALSNARRFNERRALEAELTHQALHDPLTGLPNRAFFLDRLDRRLSRDDGSVAVLFLDLDRFKYVNDSLGHDRGDVLLAAVADRLATVMRPNDVVARLGGDEFTVLIEGVHDVTEAEQVAQRLLEVLVEPFALRERDVRVDATIGIAVAASGEVTPAELLRRADVAMYRGKDAGRSRYAVFRPTMFDTVARRLELEADLRAALERHELDVRFQPVVELGRGEVCEAEALVRWAPPGRPEVPPRDFLPVAAEAGLLRPVGLAVIDSASDFGDGLAVAGLSVPLSVNVTQHQLRDATIYRQLLTVAAGGITWLRVEMAEADVVGADADTLGRLRGLADAGVGLVIDDYGSGYASLTALPALPVVEVKLGVSIVQDLVVSVGSRAVVRSIVGLAHDLGIAVTAVGVESAAQMSVLGELGCDRAQGFLLHEPVSADELFHLLRQQSDELHGHPSRPDRPARSQHGHRAGVSTSPGRPDGPEGISAG